MLSPVKSLPARILAEDAPPLQISSAGIRTLALPFLVAVAYFTYAGTARFGFIYDDVFQIVQNPRLESWRFLPHYFTQHFWAHVPGAAANLYRPLFLVWLLLNNQVFGHEPAGWHLATVLLHVGATVLMYRVAQHFLKDD